VSPVIARPRGRLLGRAAGRLTRGGDTMRWPSALSTLV